MIGLPYHLPRLLAALIIAISVASVLSACGKKGPLEPPPTKEETKKRR